MAGKGGSTTESRKWLFLVAGASILAYGLLIWMGVPLFFLLYAAYLCYILPFGLINKFFKILTVTIPLVEAGGCVCIVAAGYNINSYFWGDIFIDLAFAAGLSLFTLLVVRGVTLVEKSSNRIHNADKWDRMVAQQEIVDYVCARIMALCDEASNKSVVFRMEADSYTGELLMKCKISNEEFKFDSYVKGGKDLQLFLKSYYFYSVGDIKSGKKEIIPELRENYKEVWMDMLKNCEKELHEILVTRYRDKQIGFEIYIS